MNKQDIEKYLEMVGLELQKQGMTLAEKLGILKQDDVIALLAQYVPKDDIPDDVLEEIKLRFEP